MKKIILTVAMLLAGGYLFAQGSLSNISETGNYNRAIVTQAGSHTSSVIQKSNSTSVVDENLTTITQTNIPAYNNTGNSSVVEQYGKSHISTVVQIGDNKLEAYIGSDRTTDDANFDNEISARQFGVDNIGKQYIRGAAATKSLLILNQGGQGNNSVQTASWAVSSKGSVFQSGDANDSWQQVDGNTNEAYTTQLGSTNYSFQWVNDGGSSGNINTVLQTGNLNRSQVITKGDDNNFSLSQIGNSNRSVGITGNIYTNAEQIGDRNKAVLTQTGDNNDIWLEQKGDDNTIKGTSSVGALQLGSNNKTIFSQVGEDNTIISKQLGHNNDEKVLQTGDTNSSDVRQLGNHNTSNVLQAHY